MFNLEEFERISITTDISESMELLEDKLINDGRQGFMQYYDEAIENKNFAFMLFFKVREVLYDHNSDIYVALSECDEGSYEQDLLDRARNIDPYDEEGISNLLSELSPLKEEIYLSLFEMSVDLDNITTDGFFTLAREISFAKVPSAKDIKQNVGICWSWDDDNAESYCGEGQYKLLFKTKVSLTEAIDKLDTEFFAVSNIVENPDETEFRFRDGSELNNVEIDLSISNRDDFFLVPEFSQTLELVA